MSIWVISKYASGPSYGAPTRQFFFAKHFKQITNDEVYLVGSRSVFTAKYPSFNNKNDVEYIIDGVNINILNGPQIKGGFNLTRFWSWIVFEFRLFIWALKYKGTKPKLIIVSSLSILTIISGIIFKWKYKTKLVFEVRDIYPLTLMVMKNWTKNHPIIKVLSIVEKLGYKKADFIVGTMPNLVKHLKTISPENAHKVHSVPMGYDTKYFDGINSEEVKNNLDNFFSENNLNDKFVAGYAGTIGKANCVDQIILAAKNLTNTNIAFVIIGDGPDKETLVNLSKELNLKNVFFHDKIDRKKMIQFLSKCDVLLNPWLAGESLYQYGVSPNKWIDYMYSAKPIIVTYDGYQSIINEANCGFFIQANNPELLANKILEVSKMTSEKLKEIGDNGKTYLLKNHSYNNLAQKYLSICNYN
jgi:glycosyltransferase involved in cell wall biosynthesis